MEAAATVIRRLCRSSVVPLGYLISGNKRYNILTMKRALLTQISQPVLAVLITSIPVSVPQTTISYIRRSKIVVQRTYCRTTSHSAQKTGDRLVLRPVTVQRQTQPRHGNDLLHCLTGNPVSCRSSRIRSNNLTAIHQYYITARVAGPKTYDSMLESERQCRRSVSEFYGTAWIRVVICHSTKKGRGLDRCQ